MESTEGENSLPATVWEPTKENMGNAVSSHARDEYQDEDQNDDQDQDEPEEFKEPPRSVMSSSAPKQESVTVFGNVPPALNQAIRAVDYPPTKQTRFMLTTDDLQHQLTKKIQSVIPGAFVEFKPNKAEVADMTLYSDAAKTDRIGCVNFIHQDRPKTGSPTGENRYVEIMFFNFRSYESYDKLKAAIIGFFRELATAPVSVPHEEDYPMEKDSQYGGRGHGKRHRQTKKKRVHKKKRTTMRQRARKGTRKGAQRKATRRKAAYRKTAHRK